MTSKKSVCVWGGGGEGGHPDTLEVLNGSARYPTSTSVKILAFERNYRVVREM